MCFKSGESCVNGFGHDPFFASSGVTFGWEETPDMDTTFHDEERQARTLIRARRAERNEEEERERVIYALIEALDPFPEARMAVVAALERVEAPEASGLRR
jgi:hypothetical protein